MSYSPDQLTKIAESYAEVAEKALIVEGKKKAKKLDPKAKVRTKPSPVVPAGRAKDDHDHFPVGSISQARNALARVMQYDKAPPWYKGSLKSLQEAVRRKVHSKYPSIKISDKKSSLNEFEEMFAKYAEEEVEQAMKQPGMQMPVNYPFLKEGASCLNDPLY